MEADDRSPLTESEMFELLLKGAVLNVSSSGVVSIAALDDLPPTVRECFRASHHQLEDWAQEHRSNCPSCLEGEADCCDWDAAAWREEGDVENARALEARAAAIRLKAAGIRAAGD